MNIESGQDGIGTKLRAMGMCYYALAALCIPAAIVAPLMLVSSLNAEDEKNGAFPAVMAIAGLLSSLIAAFGIAAAGHGFRAQRWWSYCFVVAILICPSFPVGTALGASSLVVLNKPEARRRFARPAAGGNTGSVSGASD